MILLSDNWKIHTYHNMYNRRPTAVRFSSIRPPPHFVFRVWTWATHDLEYDLSIETKLVNYILMKQLKCRIDCHKTVFTKKTRDSFNGKWWLDYNAGHKKDYKSLGLMPFTAHSYSSYWIIPSQIPLKIAHQYTRFSTSLNRQCFLNPRSLYGASCFHNRMYTEVW